MAGLVPAIHVFTPAAERGCPATQTSLGSLRMPDCVPGLTTAFGLAAGLGLA
jgi:hypothetical protein